MEHLAAAITHGTVECDAAKWSLLNPFRNFSTCYECYGVMIAII